MTAFLASLTLIAAAILTTLGNFWFTYGIWPRNWFAFIGFAVISIVNYHVASLFVKEVNK